MRNLATLKQIGDINDAPFLLLTMCVTLVLSTPAMAQSPCNDRDVIITRLQSGYGEQVSFRAIDQGGRLIEILTSPPDANGRVTWTLIRTTPGGPTCMLSAGTEFEEVPVVNPSTKIGHLQGTIPQGSVLAICRSELDAMELAPLSLRELEMAILFRGNCFLLNQWTPAWMTRVAGCVVNVDNEPVCVVETHSSDGGIGYTWIFGTEAEIIPLMNNGIVRSY